MIKKYTPGFSPGELSTVGGILGTMFFTGLEVMPDSWKPYLVVLTYAVFTMQIIFRRKEEGTASTGVNEASDYAPKEAHTIRYEDLPEELKSLIRNQK